MKITGNETSIKFEVESADEVLTLQKFGQCLNLTAFAGHSQTQMEALLELKSLPKPFLVR